MATMTQYAYQNTTKKNQFGKVTGVVLANLRFLKVKKGLKYAQIIRVFRDRWNFPFILW